MPAIEPHATLILGLGLCAMFFLGSVGDLIIAIRARMGRERKVLNIACAAVPLVVAIYLARQW
jgi:hypothetical protein